MKRIVLPLVLVAVAASVFVLRERIADAVYQRSVTSGSASILVGIEELATLETATVVHKVVFPHDYLQDDLTVYQLLERIRRGDGDAESVLSRRELLHFQAANLAGEVGLATAPGAAGFVVVTTVRRYGYDLDALIPAIRAALDGQPSTEGANGADGSRPVVELPPASLLSFEIEDPRRDRYPYGEIPLDAEAWQAVSGFVREAFRATDDDRIAIEEATATAADVLQALVGGDEAPIRVIPASLTGN